jgi:hypothetical protein
MVDGDHLAWIDPAGKEPFARPGDAKFSHRVLGIGNIFSEQHRVPFNDGGGEDMVRLR